MVCWHLDLNGLPYLQGSRYCGWAGGGGRAKCSDLWPRVGQSTECECVCVCVCVCVWGCARLRVVFDVCVCVWIQYMFACVVCVGNLVGPSMEPPS